MPDYSVLPLLHDTLGVSINELLSGEKLNEDNYQIKLEENLVINIAKLKKSIKKIILTFIIFIISILIFFIIIMFLEMAYHNISYTKLYVPNDRLKVDVCQSKDEVYVMISAIDNKPIDTDLIYDLDSKTFIYKPYRYKKYSYMGNSGSNIESSLNDMERKSIKVHNKVVYESGMNIKKCEFKSDKVD